MEATVDAGRLRGRPGETSVLKITAAGGDPGWFRNSQWKRLPLATTTVNPSLNRPADWHGRAAGPCFRGMTDRRVGKSVGKRSSGVARRSCGGAAAELRSVLPTVLPEVPSKSKPLKMRPRISKIVAQPRAAPSSQSRTTHRPNIGQQCLALYLPSLKPLSEQ